jgi:hypothetical protein
MFEACPSFSRTQGFSNKRGGVWTSPAPSDSTGINPGLRLELEPVEAVKFPAEVDHEPSS